MQVNLDGAYYVTQGVLALHAKCQIRSSDLHLLDFRFVGRRFGVAYKPPKRGVIGLAHAIRIEEKENGIDFYLRSCPGLVDTELIDKRPVKPSAERSAKLCGHRM